MLLYLILGADLRNPHRSSLRVTNEKTEVQEIKFLASDHTADRGGARGRQTCDPSGSKATSPSTLLVGAPVASLLEFSQTFQTEISFSPGVDISIFPPWSPGKGNL